MKENVQIFHTMFFSQSTIILVHISKIHDNVHKESAIIFFGLVVHDLCLQKSVLCTYFISKNITLKPK